MKSQIVTDYTGDMSIGYYSIAIIPAAEMAGEPARSEAQFWCAD